MPAERGSQYILGVRVDATTYTAATGMIIEWAMRGESRYVIELPVNMVMEAYDCPENRTAVNGADLVTPGGMPIVWSLRRLGFPGQPRVYGPELTLRACEAATHSGIPVGFYGGTEKAVTLLASRMQEKYSGLKVVYICSPPFRALTAAEKETTIMDIRRSGCRILFVGLGCPKQERWMAAHRGVLPVIMLGVGAAFDFLSGQKPQAYPWMQRLGLEWAFRLATEPRRLWFRYFYQNPRFVALIAWQLFRAAWLAPPQSARTGPANLTGATQSDTAAGAIRLELLESSLSQKRVQLCLKRVFDQCGAAVALLTLAPALLLIAVLVRSSSRGPVLFRQARVGYRGKEFVMYKFRSMRVEGDPALAALQHVAAQQGVLVKVEHDPRVTGVGRVLRATSLDELPQLFNILKGQMSFVGPRPLIAFMLQPCPEFARARSLVRPGITGLWQVRERHNNTSAFSMKAHDLEYVQQFSLRLDMAILFKTARVVVSRQGAC